MKTISCIALTCGLSFSPAFAQGTLYFNSSSALVRFDDGSAVPVGGGQAQFAWAPLGTASVPFTRYSTAEAWIAANPGWTVLGAPATISLLPGRFSGGILTAQTSPPGAVIQGVVIAWTGVGAADFLAGYAGAVALGARGAYGITLPFTMDTGDPTTVPAGTPGYIYNSTSTPYTGVTLIGPWIMPEPSGFALAALGALVAWVVRRRK